VFLIDDLLTAPGKAVLFIFQEMVRKAREELLDDESVKRELQEIYTLLSSGKISEAEFEGREDRLLERLEEIAKLKFQSKSETDADPPAQINAPHAEPIIESQLDIASLSGAQSQNSTLSTDVFEALRSLSHLVSPVISDPEADTVRESAGSVPELVSPPSAIGGKEPQRSKPALLERVAAPDHAQPSCEPIPAAVVESVSAGRPPIQQQLAPVVTTPAPCLTPSAPKPIQMSDAIDFALRTLAITKLRVSSIISAAKTDDGWRVVVELVERAAVPDSGDLLGVYDVQLNHIGDVMRYERTRVRRRNDLR
jgi:hypothetical protein